MKFERNGGAVRQILSILTLVLPIALTGCQHTPPAYVSPVDGDAVKVAPPTEAEPRLGPLATALQREVGEALKATEWPNLDPSMESVIAGPPAAAEVRQCGSPSTVPGDECTWGSATAPVKIVLVGDSIGLSYANPLRLLAENSNGQVQVHSEALPGCQFADDLVDNADEGVMDACPARKQHAIDFINATEPSVVIVADSYGEKEVDGDTMSPQQWADSVKRILTKFTGRTGQIVMLSAPPADVKISECYGKRSATPADCVSNVTEQWHTMARTEQGIAEAVGGIWIDSRLWFCNRQQLCPSFVGMTPTKFDAAHMSPAYGERISPVIAESFREAAII